jgi:hypothetical protein
MDNIRIVIDITGKRKAIQAVENMLDDDEQYEVFVSALEEATVEALHEAGAEIPEGHSVEITAKEHQLTAVMRAKLREAMQAAE